MEPIQSTANILLVDDNPTNLKVLAEALQGQGWKTLVAIDGKSAIKQAEYARPDLIFLDVMMPEMDGFRTCEHLKASSLTQSIPVIFMTALSDAVNKVKGLELGAVDYITKPFQQEEVIARAKLHLKLFQLAQTLEQQNILLQQKIQQQAATELQLQQLTQELEQRVQERTVELKTSLEQLQNTQLQLIQSEKMSTLGQLVAGIGHEINNPIGSVSVNLRYIEGYTKDLLNLIDLYQQQCPEPSEKISELMEEIDFPYLVEDVPKLVASVQHGVTRLKDISASLRAFARADTGKKVEYQVQEGIDSALMLLKHRLKANEHHPEVQIVKHYSELPPIPCYPGQLNQVFTNILANAIDAFEEANQLRSYEEIAACPNQITITTTVNSSAETITIRIQDNGPGIPEQIQAKVFEQSFTTKPVGKGTGLGLAISRQIITDKHNGQLECHSTPGVGTEFVITLPL